MTEATIHLAVSQRAGRQIATIAVDNPGKINILSPALIDAFIGRIADVRAMADVRAVVLTGGGDRAFIGGADICAMATFGPEEARRFIISLHDVCRGLRTLPVPVIARIDGHCLGAGLEIAAACDMRVATTRSLFGMPEVRVGIPSVIEAALLPGLIGWGKTRELLLTGATLDAAEAARIGLVERVVDPPSLDEAVKRWLEGILACGPRALALQKTLMLEWEALPMEGAIAAGIDAFEAAYASDEPHRMMDAFLNRRRD